MYDVMRRTTISLPEDLADAVDRAARRRHVSVSELTRRALAEHVGFAQGERRPVPFANLGSSGYTTTAEDIEEILAKEWVHDRRS
jgi:metal-responsive CopG/Arc/MetJ family transcriptional regulator